MTRSSFVTPPLRSSELPIVRRCRVMLNNQIDCCCCGELTTRPVNTDLWAAVECDKCKATHNEQWSHLVNALPEVENRWNQNEQGEENEAGDEQPIVEPPVLLRQLAARWQ